VLLWKAWGSQMQHFTVWWNTSGRLSIPHKASRFLVSGLGNGSVLLFRASLGKGWNVGIDHEKFQCQTLSSLLADCTSKCIQPPSKAKEQTFLCSTILLGFWWSVSVAAAKAGLSYLERAVLYLKRSFRKPFTVFSFCISPALRRNRHFSLAEYRKK
jgi:hypothetical protein